MAFPYLFEADAEEGTNGAFNSEVDTNSKLAVRHYEYLARNLLFPDAIPYRGAYCWVIDLSLGTADAYLEELEGFDTALAGTIHIAGAIQITNNLVMAASDQFVHFALQSAGPVNEVTVEIRNNAGVIEILASDNGVPTVRAAALTLNRWHVWELSCTLDSGVGNDGTINFFLDGYQVGAQLTAIDQAVITQARWGAVGIDAGTTAGYILMDRMIADDTRVYPVYQRYGNRIQLTKSGHVAVGSGRLEEVVYYGGNAVNNEFRLFDTDEANVNAAQSAVLHEWRNQQGQEVHTYNIMNGYGQFQRGLYVQMTGTDPRAMVILKDGLVSTASIKNYALRRRAHGGF